MEGRLEGHDNTERISYLKTRSLQQKLYLGLAYSRGREALLSHLGIVNVFLKGEQVTLPRPRQARIIAPFLQHSARPVSYTHLTLPTTPYV